MRERKKTWEQKTKLVKESYLRSIRDERFAGIFYENLFFLAPATKKYFKNTNLENQKKALVHGLKFLFGYFEENNSYARSQIKRLAITHSRQGLNIHPHHYYYWIEALIMTFKDLDPKWHHDMSYYTREVVGAPVSFIVSLYFFESSS